MITFHGLTLITIICWLAAFPGGLIVALIFFHSKFWKNLNEYFAEWLDSDTKQS